MKKWVYRFHEGNASMKALLGGKGANLAEMTRLGLPVPPGFTITTQACRFFQETKKFPSDMEKQVLSALKALEQSTGKKFGDVKNPLLLSVRSGAPISMPGMMDTILNLGLNQKTLKGLTALTGNKRFCQDAYRRFIQMFGKIVLKIPAEKFEKIIEEKKKERKVKLDTELDAKDLAQIARKFKKLVKKETGKEFPVDPYQQLRRAIKAVFASWNTKRAVEYRRFHKIADDLGTAVNIQTMVFGNMGKTSATGVAFTRDPRSGERRLFGEYLLNAQGEDVVAGIRTPNKIADMAQQLPQVYKQLVKICQKLEKHYRDVQDVEFTIENGKLWMLQTRTGKRTAAAAVKIAVDLCQEGIITKKEAVKRIKPQQIEQLLHPTIDLKAKIKVIAKGINASPGAASGQVVFDAETAKSWSEVGKKVILVRPETNPDDVPGMLSSQGVLTARGGMTSHAAVVARGLGKPCVAGCEGIKIDLIRKKFKAGNIEVKQGDIISINGSTGEVILGKAPLIEPMMTKEFKTILSWADEIRRLGVWANADNPKDAKRARELGAEGIGLCRTEHMFFGPKRRPLVQKMIMSKTVEEREKYLAKLLPFQRKDFEEIFKVMNGLPVIIRLIDPPMHEFLPRFADVLAEVVELRCKGKNPRALKQKEKLLSTIESLSETNPMLGLRGCRTGIIYPEISQMQVRAIFEAACRMSKKGVKVKPEVMIPLVSHVNELKIERKRLEEIAKKVMEKHKVKIDYKFGTMIEVPRAALTADRIAKYAQFFSFGTNDLTQMTFGISRDDAEGKFLFPYIEKGLLTKNPFETLDTEGVGKLIEMAVAKGRLVRSNLEIGICGEHGGDPQSIAFCHKAHLSYVSCSPFRVPVARLAAAHAALTKS